MKRFVKSASNSSNLSARADFVTAAEDADDEAANTLEDKISSAEDDFEYIISGLGQLDTVQANEMINNIHEALQGFIQEIADQLTL